MKLTIHDDLFSQVAAGTFSYDPSTYPTPCKFEVSVSAGYSEITDVADWNRYWPSVGIDYIDYRNYLIDTFEPTWGTLSDDQKKALIEQYVWPSETTGTELDALYTSIERLAFKENVVKTLETCGCIFKKSSTSSSEKYFNLTVDDGGIMDPQELLTDVTL